MTTAQLPDPRQYPDNSPGNRLIQLTMALLSAPDATKQAAQHALLQVLTEVLERGDMLLLSVALNMVPSREAYQTLWQSLRRAVEQAPGRHAQIFAMPLVLVAGSRQRTSLPDHIADVDGLNALLRQHGVFAAGANVFLSGKLLHPDSVLGISPAQLYRYTRQLADAARGLPLDLPGSAVELLEEGVFLRYLLGVAIQQPEAEPVVSYRVEVGSWGRPLLDFLASQLHTPGVTLFPLARSPAPLMQAIVAGQQARLDVALQVFASSALRDLRSRGKQARAQMASHENNEIHFSLSSVDDDEQQHASFVWPLSPLDSVPRIEQEFCQLMRECQVDECIIVPEIVAAAGKNCALHESVS
jgi:hypothetical protein